MSDSISSMLSTNFTLGSSQTLYWTSDAYIAQQSSTIAAGVYRCWLVDTGSAAGTTIDPWCSIQRTREVTSNYFNFGLNSEGKVTVQYLGPTTGSLSFVSASVWQAVLGFTSSMLQFNSGTIHTATHQPYGAVFVSCRTADTAWQRSVSQTAYQELPTGEVYGWSDGYVKSTRQYDLRFLPTNQNHKTALSSSSTPALPVSTSLWGNPPLVGSGYTYPFTFSHFMSACPGKPVAVAHSNFQANISGTDRTFEVVYIRPKTLEAKDQFQPSITGFAKWTDFKTLSEVLTSSGERETYTAPGIVFSPAGVSNLYAWYGADYVSNTGTAVTALLDKSGYGRHLTQSVGASQPFLSSSDISYANRPVIYYDGGDNLDLTANSSFNLRQPCSIYLVAEQDKDSTAYGTYFDSIDSNRIIWRKSTDNTGLDLYAGSTLSGTMVQHTKHVACMVLNTGSADVYTSGSVRVVSGAIGSAYLGNLRVGMGNSGLYGLTGRIAELMFFTGSHNDSTRTQVLDYLDQKYWSPSSIPNMHAWWSARHVHTGSSSLISQVQDLSGRERHLVQATESRRPTLVVDPALNNKPVMQFNGAAQLLATAASHALPRQFTIIFVLGNTATRGMIAEHGYGSSVYVYATGNAAVYVTGPATVTTTQNPVTTWATEYQIGSARYDRTVAPLIRGGAYGAITDLTPTGTSGTSMSESYISAAWYVGNRSDFTLPHNGGIAEVLVYERSLSIAELQRIEAYLNSIYGV